MGNWLKNPTDLSQFTPHVEFVLMWKFALSCVDVLRWCADVLVIVVVTLFKKPECLFLLAQFSPRPEDTHLLETKQEISKKTSKQESERVESEQNQKAKPEIKQESKQKSKQGTSKKNKQAK
jgi:hypothetical protein